MKGLIMYLEIKSQAQTQLIDITDEVQKTISKDLPENGLCHLYVPHTTAAVTINENADPSVKEDILMVINKMIPWKADYRHTEGNSPAHVKASLFGASETIVVEKSRLVLGTWQGIFFCEFDGPRNRKILINFITSNNSR